MPIIDPDPELESPMTGPEMGYGPEAIPEQLIGDPVRRKGRTKCDLHIPHKMVGRDLAEILEEIPGITTEQSRRIGEILARLDENWTALEEWQHYFFRYCICHCTPTNPE